MLETNEGALKSSSVHKTLVLAIVFDIPETHENVKRVFDLIEINDIQHVFSMDLKLMNLVSGISSTSSRHCCPNGMCMRSKDGGSWV